MKSKDLVILAACAGGAFFLMNSQAVRAMLPRRTAASAPASSNTTINADRGILTTALLPFGGYLAQPLGDTSSMLHVNNNIPMWNDFSFIRTK